MKYLLRYVVCFSVLLITAEAATADLTDDLVVYFTFDTVKGKQVLDESGNGLDAEVIKNTRFVEGKYGQAIHIDRETEDCVNVPAADELEISGEITMAAWVYQTDWIGSSSQWFDKGCYTKRRGSYGMTVMDKKHFPELEQENGSGIAIILGSEIGVATVVLPNKMKNETWHHIVGVHDAEAVKVYLDGEAIVEVDLLFRFVGTNDEDLRIGCVKGKPQYAFEDGVIDEVAIWRRALSEDEIKTAMRGPLFPVSPKDKVATTWGNLKRRAF